MKNVNKIREYKGYGFTFETDVMMYRFLDLYRDLFVSYEFKEWDEGCTLWVQAKGGVIPYIKKSLGKMIETCRHGRYFVKKMAS